MDKKGVTLIELLVVIGIIGILAAIAIPAYVGQQKKAARAEAFANLEGLRLLQEQNFAENGRYAASTGTCGANNPDNVLLIQAAAVLPGFKPGSGSSLSYSYCIINAVSIVTPVAFPPTTAAKNPCFTAFAYGNTASKVSGDVFAVDCDNNKNY